MAGFSTAPGTYVSNYTEVTTQYVATANGTGFSIGDVLQQTQTFNPATNPPTVLSTVWSNLTAQTTGLAVPLTSEISPSTTVTTKGFTTVSADYLYIGAATADYSNNNVLQSVSTYDTSTSPTTLVSTVWNNISQGVYGIATPPLPARISGIKNPAYQVITSFYRVVNAFTDAAVGDIVMAKYRIAYDNKILPADSIVYTNITTQVEISVSFMSDLVPIDAVNGVRQAITNNYYAIATVASQYTINDVLQNELEIDLSTSPPTIVSSTWSNLTTGSSIATPLQTNILPVDTPSSSGGAAGTVTNLYSVVSGFAQGNAQDIVENVISYNLTTNPPTKIGSVWNNVTQNVTGIAAPTITDLAALNTPLAEINKISSTATFVAKAVSAGNYAVGDIIQKVVVWDTYSSPAPTAFSVVYNNLTSGVNNITVNLANLTALGGALSNPTTISSSQLTVAITATQGPSQSYQNGIILTADGNNLQTIYIGGSNTVSTTTGYPLVPGQSISYGVSNSNAIWYIGLNATDKLFTTGN